VESARKQLEALVDDGRLVKVAGRARGYRLARNSMHPTPVPILGEIQAGDLRAAIEAPAGYVVAEGHDRRSTLFALTVRGERMRDAGILPGDVVIVRRQDTAESGEIVVALIDDEATVKRLRIRGRGLILEPANPAFEPIRPAPGTCKILGRVIEVRRTI
jgi:repressor LexA